ncbi:MAG: pathogenicity-like protein [Arenimonas sp.]
MRQMYSSPRLSNVEGVAKLLDDNAIENKITKGRTYKGVSRREFSFRETEKSKEEQPAVWVLQPGDYKRARELLQESGLVEAPPRDSFLPESLQFKEQAKPDASTRIFRIKVVLLLVIGAMAGLMALRMLVR